MCRHTTLITSLIVLCASLYFVGSTSLRVAPENQPLAGLTFLGSVDGKSFYFDATAVKWSGAKLNCQKGYMYLASISTPAQENLLREAFDKFPTFKGYFWTAGRDALTLQQLVWDHNQKPVPTNSSFQLGEFPKIITCLLYNSKGANSTYHMHTCEPASVGYGALCEIYDACSNFTFY